MKVENKVDAATITWNEFNFTHSDLSKFKKYAINVTKDGEEVIYDESLDITSSFEITSLLSSTEYEAKISVTLDEFGESELSNAIIIRTLPAQLTGNRLKTFFTQLKLLILIPIEK